MCEQADARVVVAVNQELDDAFRSAHVAKMEEQDARVLFRGSLAGAHGVEESRDDLAFRGSAHVADRALVHVDVLDLAHDPLDRPRLLRRVSTYAIDVPRPVLVAHRTNLGGDWPAVSREVRRGLALMSRQRLVLSRLARPWSCF